MARKVRQMRGKGNHIGLVPVPSMAAPDLDTRIALIQALIPVALEKGVVARIVTGPHDAHRQDPHLPMRYDIGRPRAVILSCRKWSFHEHGRQTIVC